MCAMALLLCAILLTTVRPLVAAEPVPRFEPGDCPFAGEEWVTGEDIDCGHLVVPENRRLDSDRTLRLPVAILRSTSDTPEPDPYLFIQGGPGLPSLRWAEQTAHHPQTRRIRERRDYILLDLRGTGDAPDPCSHLGAEALRTFAADLTAAEHRARTMEVLHQCAQQALEAGHDLTAYTSVQTAADIGDLMRLLPYEGWNLFGVSAGSRIALVAMRDVPDRIRSVIVDSPLPISGPDFAQAVPHFASALKRVFAACAADAECQETYPTLEADLYDAIARLDREPLVIPMDDDGLYPGGTFTVNSADLVYAFSHTLSSSAFISVYPLFVREAAGNRTVMTAMIAALGGGAADSQFNHATSRGMLCYDEAPYSSQALYERAAEPYPAALKGHGYGLGHCDDWPVPGATPEEIEPVVSSIPTLILHGEFDHMTPTAFGEELMGRLENGHMFVFPGGGHYASVDDSCAQSMILEFLDDPMARPDDVCMEDRPELSFATDMYITGGIFRVMSELLSPPRAVPLAGMAVVLITQLSAIAGWPLAALRRRLRATADGVRPSRGVQWLAGVTALLGPAFVAGLGGVIMHTASANPVLLAFGVPGSARALFLVPLLAAPVSLLSLVVAGREWRRREWGRLWRWHYTAVSVASAVFVALAIHWELI